MPKKKDTLLQQIAENNRESTVFFLAGCAVEQPIGLKSKDMAVAINLATTSGFFVEPDKIVTTIAVIAGAAGVAAIPSDRLTKASSNRGIRFFRRRNHSQVSDDAEYTIEGVTAFDTKNNLVLLKIAETGVPLPLGNSDTVEIGETVYTLSYDDNVEYIGKTGMFQSKYRDDKRLQIQTDFSSGNGGAPVLNSKNEVVGVAAYGTGAIYGDGNATVATAISSNVLKELLANSGKVIPLERMQKHSRVRAYVLEAQADEKVELHDDRGALRDYNTALKLNPDLVEIYSKRGLVKNRMGNLHGAFKDLDRMIQINPEHIFAYNNRASARGNLGDKQGALDDLNKAIEINPEYAMAYFNLAGVKGLIAENKTDGRDIVEAKRYYQEAVDHYNKALALNPRNRLARKQRRHTKRILWLLKFLPEAV